MLLPRIKRLAPYVPGLSIAEIQEKYGLAQVVKLASNENPLGASPLVQAALATHACDAFRYPQGGNPRLRKALAEQHGASADRVMVGNGSDEIIDLLMRLTCEKGINNIVCFAPCFSIYPIQAEINGLECRRQALEPDFSFDLEKLLNLADENTGLVFITTPDNPSGYCPDKKQVRELARRLAERVPNALLAIDEAYMDFSDPEQNFSLLASNEVPDNAVILRTMSKSYGLAGARLGYAIGPAEIAQAFWAARLPFSVNILAEEAALAALADTAFREATLATVKSGRAYLAKELANLGCKVWPSSANFLMFQLPNPEETRACHQYLLRHGIIIRPLESYGLPGHLRTSIGTNQENRAFIRALRDFLKK